jgi:hypothetical protein
MSAHIFGTSACGFHYAGAAASNHVETSLGHAGAHFTRLLIVNIVFLEAGRSKDGYAWTFKVQASETFDELKKDAEGEGEFGESASGPLVYAEVVISVVDIFFFHGFASNIAN